MEYAWPPGAWMKQYRSGMLLPAVSSPPIAVILIGWEPSRGRLTGGVPLPARGIRRCGCGRCEQEFVISFFLILIIVILSFCHFVILSFCHFVILSFCHFGDKVTSCQTASLTMCHHYVLIEM